jgi:hypothetical protein
VDLLIAFLLALGGWACTGWYFDHGLDAFDSGLFATEGLRVAEGGVYGKDFLAPYGPGRYYLIALLFSLFGPSLKGLALVWLVLRGPVAAMVYLTGRRFLPRGPAVLPALAVIFAPGALHKSFFQAVVLVNILAYLLYRFRPGFRTCFLAGLAVGIGSLFRVDAGVFGFVSFLILLWLELLWDAPGPGPRLLLKRTGAFMAGVAAAVLPLFVYFLIQVDPGLLFEAEWHRTMNVSGFARTLHVPAFSEALGTTYPQGLKLFLLALMIRTAPIIYLLLAFLVAARRVRGDLEAGNLETLALTVFGIPVLNQLRITPTFNHLLHAAPLVLVSTAVLVNRLRMSAPFRRLPGRFLRGMLAAALFILPCGVPVYYNLAFTRGVLPGSIKNRSEFTSFLDLDRARIYETPARVEVLKKMVRYIESTTAPDDRIFAGPFSPVLHFLADRAPAVRYLEPFYYFGNEALQERVVEDLSRSKPPLVILDAATRVGGQSMEMNAPLVFAFIKLNYYPAGSTSDDPEGYRIWLKREAR